MYQGLIGGISGVMDIYRASGLAVSLCTIQGPATPTGSPIVWQPATEPYVDPQGTAPGIYANIPGLVNLPCQDAPESEGGVTATEIKALSETASIEVRHVLLAGYYPQLDTLTNWGDIGWRAIITNPFGVTTTFDILGAEVDSQRTQTRLKVRQVSL
jgi:hypothetical protein